MASVSKGALLNIHYYIIIHLDTHLILIKIRCILYNLIDIKYTYQTYNSK